ncbi:MAG TPA: acyltransferase family protein, partial [Anaerolineales bacterium]|nr:acyltransferase family protein [Anaerolineales bacterium]
MEKRIGYIDIAKGIGILVIVLAHNDLAGYHPTLHKFIYAFHIPLFFFLSGMFFRPERSFGETLRRRFNTLLRPYLFALFVIYLGEAAFDNMTFPVIAGRILKSLYATGYYIDWVQLWFIPHLFAVALFAWIAWRFVFGRVQRDWLRWLLLFAMLAAGVFAMPYFWPFKAPVIGTELYGLPFSLDLVFASGFFFLVGYEVNRKPLENFFASPLVLAGTFGLLLFLVLTLSPSIDFNTRSYPSLWINTAEALLGITMTLSLSRNLEKWSEKAANLFRYFGRISLVILIFHVPIQETMFSKFSRLGIPTDPSIVLAFLSGVLIPALIYELAIRYNPRLRPWFGFP